MLLVNEQGQVTHLQPWTAVESSQIRMFALREDSGWRISQASVKHALERGLQPGRIDLWLHRLLVKPMPDLMWHALKAWAKKAPPVQLGNAVVLGIPDEELFQVIAHSELFKPLLLGTMGTGWLLVRPENAKALAQLFHEYGFEVTPTHSPGALPFE